MGAALWRYRLVEMNLTLQLQSCINIGSDFDTQGMVQMNRSRAGFLKSFARKYYKKQ